MKKHINLKNSVKGQKIEACPISYKQVDKHLIKAYSSIVLVSLLFCLFFDYHFAFYIITLDFVIRVFAGIKYSPLCNILTRSFRVVDLQPVLVNAGAKKTAAIVGLLFSVIISISYLMSWIFAAKLFIIIFIIAITLDLFFDYCLACKMESLYLTYLKK